MPNIENIELLVEAVRAQIRARIDLLKSDPDPDDTTRADLERCMKILAELEVSRHPSWAWAKGPTLH